MTRNLENFIQDFENEINYINKNNTEIKGREAPNERIEAEETQEVTDERNEPEEMQKETDKRIEIEETQEETDERIEPEEIQEGTDERIETEETQDETFESIEIEEPEEQSEKTKSEITEKESEENPITCSDNDEENFSSNSEQTETFQKLRKNKISQEGRYMTGSKSEKKEIGNKKKVFQTMIGITQQNIVGLRYLVYCMLFTSLLKTKVISPTAGNVCKDYVNFL